MNNKTRYSKRDLSLILTILEVRPPKCSEEWEERVKFFNACVSDNRRRTTDSVRKKFRRLVMQKIDSKKKDMKKLQEKAKRIDKIIGESLDIHCGDISSDCEDDGLESDKSNAYVGPSDIDSHSDDGDIENED